jgi:hypothetical protein
MSTFFMLFWEYTAIATPWEYWRISFEMKEHFTGYGISLKLILYLEHLRHIWNLKAYSKGSIFRLRDYTDMAFCSQNKICCEAPCSNAAAGLWRVWPALELGRGRRRKGTHTPPSPQSSQVTLRNVVEFPVVAVFIRCLFCSGMIQCFISSSSVHWFVSIFNTLKVHICLNNCALLYVIRKKQRSHSVKQRSASPESWCFIPTINVQVSDMFTFKPAFRDVSQFNNIP